jgi:hypothetical protein
MKPEVKEKWLQALRSGQYQQASAALCAVDRDGDHAFCCLGVLCEIMGIERKDPWEFEEDGPDTLDAIYRDPSWEDDHTGFPEDRWMEEVCGLRRGEARDVADMNDRGQSFNQIADYIEASL